jgi:SAM-dependent methyltransferase
VANADRSYELREYLKALLPPELRVDPISDIACDGFLTSDGLCRMTRLLAAESAKAVVRRSLLDIGAGDSHLGEYLGGQFGYEVFTVDKYCPGRPALARIKSNQCNNRIIANYHQLPLYSESIDFIISNDAMHLTATPVLAMNECHRILNKKGALFFTTYTANGAVPGGSKLFSNWRLIMRGSRFSSFEIINVSSEWKKIMRIKHGTRLQHSKALLARFGEAARAELSVSVAMLGINGPAFLDLVERWEVVGRP